MSKLADALRNLGINNTRELLKRFAEQGKDIAVSYRRWNAERMFHPSVTTIFSPSHDTEPGAWWYERGTKSFVGNRAQSFPHALAWATKRYGIKEWAPGPFGDTIPKAVLDRAKRHVRDELKR